MATSKSSSSSSSSKSKEKNSGLSELAKPIADMVATIIVGSMNDKTQRQKNEAEAEIKRQAQRLNELSDAKLQALKIRIANANTDTERLKIYNETITELGGKSIESSADVLIASLQNKNKEKIITSLIVLSVGIILIGATIYISRKK
jgi:hypothetical protein